MTTQTERVPEERLREILDAVNLLNREEWAYVESDESHTILIVRAPNDTYVAESDDWRRAALISECDPKMVGCIVSELLVLRAAVKPFAVFAESNVDENGWKNSIHRERISDWFGPSELIALLEVANV